VVENLLQDVEQKGEKKYPLNSQDD